MCCAIVLVAALGLAGSEAPATAAPAGDAVELRVTASVVNVRSAPSVNGRVLYQVRRGDVLKLVQEGEGWLLVAAAGRASGYVRADLVERVGPSAPVGDAAARTPASTPPPESAPDIAHSPLDCVRPDENPLVVAGVRAVAAIQHSRVYFKAHQYPDWYYVDMKTGNPPEFDGVLPQPLPGTEQIDYYVQAVDANLQAAQTREYAPRVTKESCRKRALGAFATAATRIIVAGTKQGQPPVPPGFSSKGIVAFVTASGATLTGAALQGDGSGSAAAGPAVAAAHGGKSGRTLALIGGAVVAGGAAAALAAKGGGGGGSTPTTTAPPGPTAFDLVISKAGAGTGTVTSADGRIDCGPTCSARYSAGSPVVLTASAAAGSVFVQWSGDASSCGVSPQCTLTIDASKAVSVSFDVASASLKKLFVSKQHEGGGDGTVTSNDGKINCGVGCNTAASNYTIGARVTLNATPAAGSTFRGFTGACGTAVQTCVVILDTDQDVSADFFAAATASFGLTVSKLGTGAGTVTSNDGRINCGSTCSATYNAGTSVTLTAAAATGSVFAGWGGAASCGTAP
jgi:hypothetical protein